MERKGAEQGYELVVSSVVLDIEYVQIVSNTYILSSR
jgi:hypothetical protein